MKVRIEDLKFDERGLAPAIVQDETTREVLTLAYVSEESLRRTLSCGETWFYSRSRRELWRKGETSGNTQRVISIGVDCDKDALLISVEAAGPACHTGEPSCFHNSLEEAADRADASAETERRLSPGRALEELYEVVASRRREMPKGSYTTYLFEQGLDKILKKLGEETAETIIAAKNEDAHALVSETADLLFHLCVLLSERGVSLEDVARELARRKGARREDEIERRG